MKFFNPYHIGVLAALLTMPLGATSPKAVAQLTPFNQEQGLIINSGSTNTCPYTIYVQRSGQAIYTVCDRAGIGRISFFLANKFFNDIAAGQPLSQLPFTPCFKSASFGTTTQIRNQGQTSPDVSCPSDDTRVTNLYEDATAIQQALSFSVSRN